MIANDVHAVHIVGVRHGFYYRQSITITSYCFYYYYINYNLLLPEGVRGVHALNHRH